RGQPAADQAVAEPLPRPRQPALDRPDRPSQVPGRLPTSRKDPNREPGAAPRPPASSSPHESRQVDGGRPERDDGGYHTSLTPRAEPAPDGIFSPAASPMPVVLLARCCTRPSLRTAARPPAPRRRPRPGPADRHHLDQGGQAQWPV